MQNFLLSTGLTVFEEKCFKSRVLQKLEWSETVWYNKMNSRTALTAAERIVMEQVLTEIRQEVSAGTLDLRAYNNK